MPAFTDRTNKRYGRLVALEPNGKANGVYRWKCICDCGNYVTIRGDHLKSGGTRSCECLASEHNDVSSNFYNRWASMIKRCNYEENYIKHGILVDSEWKNYLTFKREMHESYLAHVSEWGEHDTVMDRKDNDGPYSLKNCRWVTWSESNRNKGHCIKDGNPNASSGLKDRTL